MQSRITSAVALILPLQKMAGRRAQKFFGNKRTAAAPVSAQTIQGWFGEEPQDRFRNREHEGCCAEETQNASATQTCANMAVNKRQRSRLTPPALGRSIAYLAESVSGPHADQHGISTVRSQRRQETRSTWAGSLKAITGEPGPKSRRLEDPGVANPNILPARARSFSATKLATASIYRCGMRAG